jgi:hypothetical protein
MKPIRFSTTYGIGLLLVGACEGHNKPCDLSNPLATCSGGLVCEDVAGKPVCSPPLVLRGRVLDVAGAGIAGARVTARDANEAPASGTVESGPGGSFELRVPSPRAEGGAILARKVKLVVFAAGHVPFPCGIRRSLPIELSTAIPTGGLLVVQNSLTDVTLFPVANPLGLGSIAGTVRAPAGMRGTLIVAEGTVSVSGVSDSDGTYVLFNVPPGSYSVRGYRAGLQLAPTTATVVAGARTSGVDLSPTTTPLGTVTGNVNIVNAPGGSATSVVLVVESTFSETLQRGEVPPGLRAPRTGDPNVTGAFTISEVPDGRYVVLAAFENDGLVRDPDTSIGGTQIQRIEVGPAGRTVSLSASFKITGALAVVSPGAGEAPDTVTGTPTFVFADDSSEDGYAIEVFDSTGTLVWSKPDLPRVTGSATVSVPYAGPALTSGAFYWFRATSWRNARVPISQTEDLKGVFRMQ